MVDGLGGPSAGDFKVITIGDTKKQAVVQTKGLTAEAQTMLEDGNLSNLELAQLAGEQGMGGASFGDKAVASLYGQKATPFQADGLKIQLGQHINDNQAASGSSELYLQSRQMLAPAMDPGDGKPSVPNNEALHKDEKTGEIHNIDSNRSRILSSDLPLDDKVMALRNLAWGVETLKSGPEGAMKDWSSTAGKDTPLRPEDLDALRQLGYKGKP